MSLNAPVVAPLQNGKLQQKANVVASQNYVDPSPTDVLYLYWGNNLPSMGAPEKNNLTNPVPFPIASNMVCDGSVTVWCSIEDKAGNIAYSDTNTLTIDKSGNTLAPATLAAVDKNAPAKGMTVSFSGKPTEVTFSLVMTNPAQITWTIYNANGTPVDNVPDHNPYVRNIPFLTDGGFNSGTSTYTTTVTPVPVGTQYVELVYSVTQSYTRGAGDGTAYPRSVQIFNSAKVTATGNDLFNPAVASIPAPLFTDASNNTLDLSQVAGDIKVTIPQTPSIVQDSITFTGSGKDAGGNTAIGSGWVTNNIYTVATTPFNGAAIPRAYVERVPDGGSYTIFYTSRNTGLTSASTTVTIKKGGTPVIGTAGILFGWGNADSGVLG